MPPAIESTTGAALEAQTAAAGASTLDEDPDFLPQERLEQTAERHWERVGVPDGIEKRSDIFEERLARAVELKKRASAELRMGNAPMAKHLYRRAFHHADYTELERMQF